MLKRLCGRAALALLQVLAGSHLLSAQAVGSRAVELRAVVGPRWSVKASASNLVFEVGADGLPAVAAIDYRAAARTRAGGRVTLTVEVERGAHDASPPAAAQPAITCQTESGPVSLALGGRTVVAQWTSSGVRNGRLACTLVGGLGSGRYLLPVRLAVAADN